VPPGDAKALEAALARVVTTAPEIRLRHGEVNRRHAETFDYDRLAARVRHEYRLAIAARQPRTVPSSCYRFIWWCSHEPRLATAIRILMIAIVAVGLWWFVKKMNFAALGDALVAAKPWPIVFATALIFLCMFGKAVAWRLMLSPPIASRCSAVPVHHRDLRGLGDRACARWRGAAGVDAETPRRVYRLPTPQRSRSPRSCSTVSPS